MMAIKILPLMLLLLALCIIAPTTAQVATEQPYDHGPVGFPTVSGNNIPCNGIVVAGNCIPGFELPLSLIGILTVAYLHRRRKRVS